MQSVLVQQRKDLVTPPILLLAAFDVHVCVEATNICILLYGRQPFAGYRITSFNRGDDDAQLLPERHVFGKKPHRFTVRLYRIAVKLTAQKDVLNRSPLLALQGLAALVHTATGWLPYQAQITLKRYFAVKWSGMWQSKMQAARVTYLECAGGGVVRLLKELCSDAFRAIDSLSSAEPSNADADSSDSSDSDSESATEQEKSSMEKATPMEKALCGQLISILCDHQSQCPLHLEVCELLQMEMHDWDDCEFIVCELRSILFSENPKLRTSLRKCSSAFLLSMKAAHKQFYLKVCLPRAWARFLHKVPSTQPSSTKTVRKRPAASG